MIDYTVNEIEVPELKNKHLRTNHFLAMKHPFRCSIIGSSGSGKTCLLRTLIEKLLDYDTLYIICPSLERQGIYIKIKQLSEECEYIKCYSSIADFNLEDLNENLTNIVIFDDVMTEKKDQPLIEKAFSWGRHCSASIFYISQSFFAIPKNIRLNCSHYCIFPVGDSSEIDRIHGKLATNIDLNNFRKMFYEACIADKYGFLFIDKTQKHKQLMFRKRLDQLYQGI